MITYFRNTNGTICLILSDYEARKEYLPRLTIFSPSFTDEWGVTPATCMVLCGKSELLALREAIDAALGTAS